LSSSFVLGNSAAERKRVVSTDEQPNVQAHNGRRVRKDEGICGCVGSRWGAGSGTTSDEWVAVPCNIGTNRRSHIDALVDDEGESTIRTWFAYAKIREDRHGIIGRRCELYPTCPVVCQGIGNGRSCVDRSADCDWGVNVKAEKQWAISEVGTCE
jgi:hypothetical protein